MKKVPRDIHLTNALIGTVHAIVHNKYIDLSPHLAVSDYVLDIIESIVIPKKNQLIVYFIV